MITNGHNYETRQPIPQLQQLQQLDQQQPTQEDIERTQRCTEDYENRLFTNNIPWKREYNRLIIRDPYIYGEIRKSVHCPSPGRYVIPNQPYEPQWLYVKKETYIKHPADIYVVYDPSTLQPEGFAMQDQLFETEVRGKPVYGIQRVKLNNDIGVLFNLNELRQLRLIELHLLLASVPADISYDI